MTGFSPTSPVGSVLMAVHDGEPTVRRALESLQAQTCTNFEVVAVDAGSTDGTARILDVHLQLLLEDPWIEEDTACRLLLSVMGTEAPGDTPATRADVLEILSLDRDLPASIAFPLNAARDTARRARALLSTEL